MSGSKDSIVVLIMILNCIYKYPLYELLDKFKLIIIIIQKYDKDAVHSAVQKIERKILQKVI